MFLIDEAGEISPLLGNCVAESFSVIFLTVNWFSVQIHIIQNERIQVDNKE